jgi:serine/threonine protein kinase
MLMAAPRFSIPTAPPRVAPLARAPAPAPVPAAVAHEEERHLLDRALHGRFTILDLVGRGGMSAVYVAREHTLDRQVALKVLSAELRERVEDRERFRREARVLAALSPHPCIAPVHALGEAAGLPYFVMPYLASSLARRLDDGARLEIGTATDLLVRLAEALEHAHGRGVVHNDLKPENVLLDDTNGYPVLIDFGVATLRTSEHSRSEVARAFGTPAYMSPEQALGEQECDGRSDLYALGVLGFQMLAGRVPFAGATPRDIIAQHVARPAPELSVFRPDVPPALERVLRRCLAKRPADRWQSGRALAEALAEAKRADTATEQRGRYRRLFARLGRR